jgi:hypothetical protein
LYPSGRRPTIDRSFAESRRGRPSCSPQAHAILYLTLNYLTLNVSPSNTKPNGSTSTAFRSPSL